MTELTRRDLLQAAGALGTVTAISVSPPSRAVPPHNSRVHNRQAATPPPPVDQSISARV